MTAMETILVVNAGSSSVKFEIFALEPGGGLRRHLKGQADGIGTRPRLRATGPDGTPIVDRSYAATEVTDVPAALNLASAWLREEHAIAPIAVGHRVLHGGPDYDRPTLIDDAVLAGLERYVCLAPLHQPHNLAPIRSIRALFPNLPQVACFDTAFHRGQHKTRRRKGGTYPLSHLYGHFKLVRLCRLGHDVPWVKA